MPIRDEQNQRAYMCITAVSVITAICWWWTLWNVDRKHQMRRLSLFPGFFFSPLWIWYHTLYRVTVVPAKAKLSSRTEIVKLSWTEVNGNPYWANTALLKHLGGKVPVVRSAQEYKELQLFSSVLESRVDILCCYNREDEKTWLWICAKVWLREQFPKW